MQIFLVFAAIGAYHMPKVIKTGLEFNLLDAIVPFVLFILPIYLFTASFLFLFTVALKNHMLSIPLYIFLVIIPHNLGYIHYFINPDMALTGSNEFHSSISPIKLYYGVQTPIILLALSVIFICLTCCFWSKNRSKE